MQKNPSSEYVDPNRIQQLISKIGKQTNHHYRQASARYSVDSFGMRQEKVFKKLAPMMSVEGFKAERQRYWAMNQFQQRKYIEDKERQFERR